MAAGKVAGYVRRERLSPAIVLCSPARRTRETLEFVAPALAGHPKTLIEEDLYGAGADELLDRLRRLPGAAGSAMLVGHNPGLQDLTLILAGGGGLDRPRAKFPTAALAILRVPVAAWLELGPGRAELAGFVVPGDLG